MNSPDSSSGAISLVPLWGAINRRLAVAIGTATALTALIFHVPVSRACLRGVLAWFLTRLVAGGITWLLVRTTAPKPEPEEDEDETTEDSDAQAA